MLRSVGAGERATAPGHPVALGNWCPYRDRQLRARPEFRLADYRDIGLGGELMGHQAVRR